MAKKDSAPNINGDLNDSEAEWFGGREMIPTDLPRFAIGDPETADADSKEITLLKMVGEYEDTIVQVVEGKPRLLHRIKPREPIQGHKRVYLWGNAQLDGALPALVPGSKFMATYKGKVKLGGGRTMKEIEVLTPEGTARRPNPFVDVLKRAGDTPF